MSVERKSQPYILAGYELDPGLFYSLICILFLGVFQLSWPSIQAYFTRPARVEKVPEMPIIETISEDTPRERPRVRFVKETADIADWAGTAQSPDEPVVGAEVLDPNTILPAGLETTVPVTADGKLLDIDGTVIEEGTIAYIRQQIIDRVINTGTVNEDENENAVMKLDIIKSIKALTDAEVIEWYTQNKEMLKY